MLNPFGLLNDNVSKLVRVDEVESGFGCNCFCPKCHAHLIAVHGTQKQWHFRHYNSEDCGGSFETAVHLLAKEVLVGRKAMRLPYLKVRTSRELWQDGTQPIHKETVVKRQLVRFDYVEDEVWMEGRIPDIVASKAGRKLLVEIVVTHDLCEDKIEWIRHRGLATVRVNLSWIGYGVDKSIIERCLYDGRAVNITPRFNIVNWVYHPREAEAQQRVNEQYLMSIKGGSFEQQKVKKAESKEVQLKFKF